MSSPGIAMPDGFAVWAGVYTSFAEAPAEGPGFDGDEWLARSVALAMRGMAAAKNADALDYSLAQRNALLPPLVTSLLGRQSRVRVLDFGGGPGLGYVALAHTMPDMTAIDYVVVDSPAVCAAGEALFANGPMFCHAVPDDEPFDIVHAASVLQYIDDWRAALALLTACRPEFLSLGDVFAGGFAPYVTLQSYYGSRIRHWVFNLDEIIAAVARHGYGLVSRQPCRVEVLGRRGALPMDHLPPALRIAHTQHLLFAREGVR